MAVLHRVCNDSPRPITEVNPDIPVWLTAIIDRLLEKQADNRFQTAAEVADLLSQCLAHVQQPAVVPLPEPVTRSARNNRKATGRPKWYVGAILMLLVFGSLGLTEATGVTPFSASVISIVRGDGTLVVEVNDPEVTVTIEGEDIVITGAGPKEVAELASGALICVAVSSDGSHLLVSNFDNEMELWDLQSNKLIAEYLHEYQIRDVVFSPDDRLAFSAGLDGNVRMWRLPESVGTKDSVKKSDEHAQKADENVESPPSSNEVSGDSRN